MTNRAHAVFAVTAAATLASCTGPIEVNTTELAVRECNLPECSSNAATVGDGIVFTELAMDGQENASGIRIVGSAAASGAPVHVRVDGYNLIADGAGGSLSGVDLLGATITLGPNSGTTTATIRLTP